MKKSFVLVVSLLLLASLADEAASQVRIFIRPWQVRPVVLAPLILPLPPSPPPAPRIGYVDLSITPADADVFVDGVLVGKASRYYGTSEYLNVEPGLHSISLRRDGFKPELCTVDVVPGGVIVLDVTLHRLASGEPRKESTYQLELDGTGNLTVKIEPADAAIYINDGFYGTAGQFAEGEGSIVLREGTHKVEINRPGFSPYSTTVKISKDKTVELVVKLQKAE